MLFSDFLAEVEVERAVDVMVDDEASQFFSLIMCPRNTFFSSAGVNVACSSRGVVTKVHDSGRAEMRNETYRSSTETVPSGQTFRRSCQRKSMDPMSLDTSSSLPALVVIIDLRCI